MVNLLEETLYKMKSINKHISDIEWIGGNDFYLDVNEFLTLADIEYNDDFGLAEVATDLKIVFKDGSLMIRHNYDGAESWRYYSIKKPETFSNIVALTVGQSKEHFDKYYANYYDGSEFPEYNGHGDETLKNLNRAAFNMDLVWD